jgi:hypothetical protein
MKMRMLIVVAATAASAMALEPQTGSYFDTQYEFGTLRTWDFKSQRRISRDPLADNELWAQMIRKEITASLRQSGFEQTTDHPDFLIAFYVGLRERYATQYLDYGFPGPWGRRFRVPWGWADRTDVWTVPYTDSTLIIDLIDGDTNLLFWRGFDTETIEMNKPYKALDKGVYQIVKRFLKDSGRRRLTSP